jgi:CcmD family protein
MADTTSYYHAAYIVAGVLYVAYAVSLITRRRRVLRRLEQLEQRSGDAR